MASSSTTVKIIGAVLFFTVAVLAIYPWRIQSQKEWQQKDLNAIIARDHDHIREVAAASDSLPADDDRRLAALKQLADCDWQENKLDEAERISSDLWIKYDKKQTTGYDRDYADVMLMAAGIHRDQGKVEVSQRNYEQIYYYDLHHSDDESPKRVARDLNNLGVAYYLVGLSKPNRLDGMDDYEKSIDYFEAALKAYRELYGKNSQYEANALYNQSLALRDSGQSDLSLEVRARSDAIMALAKRPCTLP